MTLLYIVNNLLYFPQFLTCFHCKPRVRADWCSHFSSTVLM